MRSYTLPFILLCISGSCQPVNKDPGRHEPAAGDTLLSHATAGPDITQLRSGLFHYFARHRSESQFDTLDDTYQLYGGPVNYPPYLVSGGNLFNKDQVHALLYYNDEQGAGLFVYLKKDRQWQQIFADTSERVSAGNSLPELKDWNRDGIMDLCLYHAPATSMSVIGRYALWLMQPDGKQLRYIKGFSEIENPEVDSMSSSIRGSYYYHGERNSLYRFNKDSVIKTKETWDREEAN
ncbi:MAG: hypothetical protein JNL13_04365 [Chitinophagaceae bacterium]|nr:hypothetical protein [Chitinophagaceae bacterium]